jgi:hypothetical protein
LSPVDRVIWRSGHRVIESLAIGGSGDRPIDRRIADRVIASDSMTRWTRSPDDPIDMTVPEC